MGIPVQSQIITFERGLVTSASPLSEERGMELMDNVYLSRDSRGGLEAADGATNKIDITGVNLRGGGFFNSQTTGDSLCVVVGGGKVYEINTSNGSETSLKDSLTSGEKFGITALEDVICFFNGNDTPFKSTIESSPTISNLGLTRLDVSSASSALGTAGGNVQGTVMYWVAGMDGANEGPLSKPFGRIDARDGYEVDLSSVPLPASGIVRLYRTYADGANPYYVDTLDGTASGTTSYTDNLPDRNLGNPPLKNGDPPKSTFRYATTHRERIFALEQDTSKIWWSDLNEPDSWYIPGDTINDTIIYGNWINVYGEDGDRLTAIARTSDGLLLFKQNHLYRLRGRFPDEYIIDEVTLADQNHRTVGTLAQHTVTAAPGAVYFIYDKGLYAYSNGVIRYVSKDIESELESINGDPLDEDKYGIGYWRSRRWVCLSIERTANAQSLVYPNKTYFYDTTREQWVGTWDVGFDFFLEVDDGDKFEFWGCGGGTTTTDQRNKSFEFDGSQTFDGNAISTEGRLPPIYGGNPHAMKRWLYVDVYFEPKASGTFNLEYEVDGKSSSTTSVAITQSVSSTDLHQKRVNIGLIGRDLQLSITSNADQPRWKVLGMTVGFQTLTSKSQ